jgi:hypothetical protein
MHDNHWDTGAEVQLSTAPVTFGGVVPSGKTRRIREITVRNYDDEDHIIILGVNLNDATEERRLTFRVPAQTTLVWSSENGRSFSAGEQPEMEANVPVAPIDVYVSGAGIEA